MGGTPEHQLTQRPEPRPSGRRGGPALNLALNPARIVPRQEAVDSSNNLYRPTNLMAPCAPVPDAQIGQAPRVTRSWLEAELLMDGRCVDIAGRPCRQCRPAIRLLIGGI